MIAQLLLAVLLVPAAAANALASVALQYRKRRTPCTWGSAACAWEELRPLGVDEGARGCLSGHDESPRLGGDRRGEDEGREPPE